MANMACNYEADYSLIAGERQFPYRVTLNLGNSVLSPEIGEKQTFCYDIMGVGSNTASTTVLQYLMLGICSGISQTNISSLAVSYNDIQQPLTWGQNLSLKTPDDPDPVTGGMGLKVSFPMTGMGDCLRLTLVLNKTYDIGPVDILLYGAETAMSGLTICGPVCGSGDSCGSVVYQQETVCVPVTVTPYAKTGTAMATCCGAPQISDGTTCTGSATSCSFSVSQSLCVAIPISFGAAVHTGTVSMQCGTATESGCNCSGESTTDSDTNASDSETNDSGSSGSESSSTTGSSEGSGDGSTTDSVGTDEGNTSAAGSSTTTDAVGGSGDSQSVTSTAAL
jgi:hypothetical protein